MCDEKDLWDKADVVGKWLIPLVIAGATWRFNVASSERQDKQNGEVNDRQHREKNFAVAITLLQAPIDLHTLVLRNWAVNTFRDETKATEAAVKGLREGAQLPNPTALQLPNPGQMRVRIIRPSGTALDSSEQIRGALAKGGYNDIVLTERPLAEFPARTDVRYYYTADKDNAEALNLYMNKTLCIMSQVNDKSSDAKASDHHLGEIHIYVKN